MISKETFYLGMPNDEDIDTYTANSIYNMERSDNVFESNPKNITQYIGLMYPSDYMYAAGESCLSTPISNYVTNGCNVNNYLYAEINEWLQTPYVFSNGADTAMYLNNYGRVDGHGLGSGVYIDVRPVLHLKEEVQITGGTGTQNDPYIIE